MHGHSPGFGLIVNAEVDSMGGVIDGGVGVDSKASPLRAEIERAQAELRQEHDVREERRRELEFLENGGNPLDFKFGPAISISVHSTSLIDQLAEHEAKGSFALAASPHGDSVESSGRPGASLGRETNTADNLLFFNGENDVVVGGKNSANPPKRDKNAIPEDKKRDAKDSGESAIFRLGVKSQAYARRNRSRTNRDIAHTGSSDLTGHGRKSTNSQSSRQFAVDAKGQINEAQVEKVHRSSICNTTDASQNGNVVSNTPASHGQLDVEFNAAKQHRANPDLIKVAIPEDGINDAVKRLRDCDYDDKHPQDDSKHGLDASPTHSGLIGKREKDVTGGFVCLPCETLETPKIQPSEGQIDEFSVPYVDVKDQQNDDQDSRNNFAGTTTADSGRPLDSDSSFTQINHNVDGNAVNDQCSGLRNVNRISCGDFNDQNMVVEGNLILPNSEKTNETKETASVEDLVVSDNEPKLDFGDLKNSIVQEEIEFSNSKSVRQGQEEPLLDSEGTKRNDNYSSHVDSLADIGHDSKNVSACPKTVSSGDLVSTSLGPVEAVPSVKDCVISAATPEIQKNNETPSKLTDKAREDAILQEARAIEAKLKRISKLSICSFPSERRRKSQWDFVLEEMAWLANDFMQERLWKTSAAAQICRWISCTGKSNFDKTSIRRNQRKVAHSLAKAVMHFWHSAKVLQVSSESIARAHGHRISSVLQFSKVNAGETRDERVEEPALVMDTGKCKDEEYVNASAQLPIEKYAVRFLEYDNSADGAAVAEAPTTPDRMSDLGSLSMSWEGSLSEERLFYTVLPGAMQFYRTSTYSRTNSVKIANSMHQEDCGTSMRGSVTEFGAQVNAYEEDEGETDMYYSPLAFEGSKSTKYIQKKKKNLHKSHVARSYDVGAEFNGIGLEVRHGGQSSVSGKRPPSNLCVGSIPTKRVRTASRQRIASPFNAGATGGMQVPSKTDISSGDTSSLQDDQQSSLHLGSQPPQTMEVESQVDSGKQFPYDGVETPIRIKKKKKPKHLGYRNSMNLNDYGGFIGPGNGSVYEQKWQFDSMVQHEQQDIMKKRLENHHFESNGSTGPFDQHPAKKPRLLKQVRETSPEMVASMPGSIPSPVASQMSNMSNPNKLIKMMANRDRVKKTRAPKMAGGQSGSDGGWSNFEDQALVVLVHDMGPNWELISDAINSTLQFKCIFRKPKECKERHKFLMDRNAGDGADSAEDSGSSQPYPSTLPGIPKGSARQLFQRLKGPMEEDALKAHFEKIILLGQKLHSNQIQETKQITPVHESHILALTQICPNNMTGVPLTPLDFCDSNSSSSDTLALGYHGPHGNNLIASNQQAAATPVLSSPGSNTLQGSSRMVVGNGISSPSAVINPASRDTQRYGLPRPTSLPIDEQQRMPQYNQMLSGRNIQQTSMTASGPLPVGSERGVRILPGGNGMGMMCGVNRGMPLPRPAYQGMSSPGMLNIVSSGAMLSSSGVGMPNPVNMNPGAVSGQGNSMLRPREALQMMRPVQNPDDQRQILMQELQLQVPHGNGQPVLPFNGINTPYTNPLVPSSVQSFPVHHQQHQIPSPQQQTHMHGNSHHPPHIQGTNQNNHQQQSLRASKGRQQQQQRLLHQQQQQQNQFPTSTNSMPPLQLQSQHPMSSLQNNSQIQQQASHSISQHTLTGSSSTPLGSIPSQAQQKPNQMSHALGQSQSLNQMVKQRQRPQQQQSKLNQQQRQPSQAKLLKGLGRGGAMMHMNLPIDTSHGNGVSLPPGSQVTEKGEAQQVMHPMQGQSMFSGSGSSTVQSVKQLGSQPPNHSQQQPKLFSRPPHPSLKQMSNVARPDAYTQGQGQLSPDHTLLTSQHSPHSSSTMSLTPQQQQQSQRQVNQSQQNLPRMLHQTRQAGSDGQIPSPSEHAQSNQSPGNIGYQMGPQAFVPPCTDSTSTVHVPSTSSPNPPSQWKADSPYETNTVTPSVHMASMTSSPQSSPPGNEPMPPSTQALVPRQYVGGVPIHGHSLGGPWQQQQQPMPPLQNRQVGEGNLYSRSSNSGPG
ncbi:hypothetical protein QJS10_CPA01g00802 [Acorus calamus]|uniref:Chromatin modification-related protein EAF1 B n=1 Tax=Acorus calamus TaxID=4465 RepID=A0AAV9FJ35_ACOCL|nr:hypothetical protein QJS10_CPA01g00802 [Acorus calamus]